MLPTYRPLLLAVQREYDAYIAKLTDERTSTAIVEGRLRTLKSESMSFVGESMGWFQQEVGKMRKRVAELEAEVEESRKCQMQLSEENVRLHEKSATNCAQAKDSHEQNQDMVGVIRRLEFQVELLRSQERDIQSKVHNLQKQLKDKETRIESLNKTLKEKTEENALRIKPEDHNAVKDECRHLEQRLQQLEEQLAAAKKDCTSIVETYLKAIGQQGKDIILGPDARPLTPRPDWARCRGLMDPEEMHTYEKAAIAQELASHVFCSSRKLLSAYGLLAAAQRSTVFRSYARIAEPPDDAAQPALQKVRSRVRTRSSLEDGDAPAVDNFSPFAPLEDAADFLMVEPEAGVPLIFQNACRQLDRVKNLRFSRRKTAEFIDGLVRQRLRRGAAQLMQPFGEFVLENLPDELCKESASREAIAEFVINLNASVRYYSAEPDFLAYTLLLNGKISDTVVRDNKNLCAELLQIFGEHFESSDAHASITKQKLFNGLREVFQNKPQESWQDIVNYFPAGRGDIVVSYEALLVDDLYVLSPIVYALRLQHLEEALQLTDRLGKLARDCPPDVHGKLRYDKIEATLRDDPEFGLMQLEDYARAFEKPPQKLLPESEQDLERFLQIMKTSDIFRMLFFPALAADDGEGSDGASEDYAMP